MTAPEITNEDPRTRRVQAWAVARLAAVGLAGPLLGPLVGVTAVVNTQRTRRVVAGFPDSVRRAAAGELGTWRTARLPADRRYLITSDLHRGHPGWSDWPTRQGTDVLYPAMLTEYADGWTLIENGDIEEMWLGGGSEWGIEWDRRRLWASRPSLRASSELVDLLTEQLQHTYANHFEAHCILTEVFLADDRYVRVVGNHDDDLALPEGRIALGRVFPGLEAHDMVALTSPSGEGLVGAILHGHQTDAWNAPGRAGLGRLSSVVGSALHDLPGSQAPGLGKQARTSGVLDTRESRLIEVSPIYGADPDLYSTDEVAMAAAWRGYWGARGWAETGLDGPAIVLGHTHLPGCEPRPADGGAPWRGYVNSGSGITPGLVTAVEWDPAPDGLSVDVRLVAWRDRAWRDGRRTGSPELERTVVGSFAAPLVAPAEDPGELTAR